MYRHRIAKAVVALTALLAPGAASAQDYNVHHSGDTVIAEVSEKAIFVRTSGDTTIVEIAHPKRFIFLPVEKDKPEVKVQVATGRPDDKWHSIRLAREHVDFYRPLRLPDADKATLKLVGIAPNALALQALKMDDKFKRPRRHR